MEVMNLKSIFHIDFLNINISVTIQVLELEFSMCVLKVVPELILSQIPDL